MARASTTSDVFNAIAEPRRRRIIELLAGGEQPVGELVRRMRLPQPAVSKHLGVLRRVRLVSVNRRGRSRLYRLHADGLRTIHEWTKMFEQYWNRQIDRIKARAEQKAREQHLQKKEN